MNDDYKGYKIRLEHDDIADDPLNWNDPADRKAWFVMTHGRYDLPNELDVDFGQYNSMAEAAEAVSEGKPYKFVRWYEHSGVAVSLRDGDQYGDWDAGCAGFIVGETTADIEQAFRPWKAYIEGEIYYVDITNEFDEDVDSCGGFYGYDDAMAAAKEMIDNDINRPYKRTPAGINAQELHR